MSNKKDATPPTIITLTLPTPIDGGIPVENSSASLLIQRGDFAHVRQFQYHGLLDELYTAMREASEALGLLEDNPPIIPDLPEEKPKAKVVQKNHSNEEPTIEIPLKKGSQTVKMSDIKIVRGESDAAAYRQAMFLAGRLIDGKLWDAETPIRFADVYAVAKKMKPLSDKDFSMFTLEDFVQVTEQ